MCEVGHSSVSPGFFIDGSGKLQGSGKRNSFLQQTFHGNDRGCNSPLHVTGPSAIDSAFFDNRTKGVFRPAFTRHHYIQMPIEMHTGPGGLSFEPCHQVRSRVTIIVSGRSLSPMIADLESPFLQTCSQKTGTVSISISRWVYRRNPDEFTGQFRQLLTFSFNPLQ